MSRDKNVKISYPEFSKSINTLISQYCEGDKKAFAAELGVHYDSVRRWSNGNDLPNGPILVEIHKKYNVSLDWLLTGLSAEDAAIVADGSEDAKLAYLTVKRIFEGAEPTTIMALKMFLSMVDQSVVRSVEIKRDMEVLKEEVKHLKKINHPGILTGTDQAV